MTRRVISCLLAALVAGQAAAQGVRLGEVLTLACSTDAQFAAAPLLALQSAAAGDLNATELRGLGALLD